MNNQYYNMMISSDTKYNYYSRKYMKFQDVLALLASFMNLLISIARGIYAFYYRFKLRTYLFRRLVRIPPDCETDSKKLNQNTKIELKVSSKLSETELKLRDSQRVSNEKSFVKNF